MFAQSVGQMKTAYPNGEGMMGSCAVRTFMNVSLQDGTAKMLAEQIEPLQELMPPAMYRLAAVTSAATM